MWETYVDYINKRLKIKQKFADDIKYQFWSKSNHPATILTHYFLSHLDNSDTLLTLNIPLTKISTSNQQTLFAPIFWTIQQSSFPLTAFTQIFSFSLQTSPQLHISDHPDHTLSHLPLISLRPKSLHPISTPSSNLNFRSSRYLA